MSEEQESPAPSSTPATSASEEPVSQPEIQPAPGPESPADPPAHPDSEVTSAEDGQNTPGGPLNLARIRELRKSQTPGRAKPAAQSQHASSESVGSQQDSGAGKTPDDVKSKSGARPGKKSNGSGKKSLGGRPGKGPEVGVIKTPPPVAPKVEVPSVRQGLAPELEDELNAALGGSDLDSLLIGDEMLQVGKGLSEGQRLQGRVVKTQGEFVFLSLGGPNEGMVPATQFETPPEIGGSVEVVVRGFSSEEGLYELTLPGNAVDVSDWADISEGEVIEVLITGSNTGGLECKVGSIRGFIPASQIAEYRVENLGEFVDQKVLCVVTEANERRGNLVLSRRAVLEREKAEKRAERLASISIGDAVEGTVTKIMDFGAFVDIGGLDGLLHISQLSWDRVSHPSDILEVGQKIQVRIEKLDEQSGKIGLSYRSLQEHPWNDIDARFPPGSVITGTVTRLAEFGAFVKIATGVEGLVHISELAHHRVSSVGNVVSEGQEVEVKILSTDEESQRMSLSIKGAQAAPEPAPGEKQESQEAETPPAKPVLPKHRGPLKGGTGGDSGGEQFGLKW